MSPGVLGVVVGLLGVSAPNERGLELFEKQIRPVLVEHCYSCHATSARRVKAGLLLDSPAGWLRGGDSGPALIPGEPDRSPILRALRYADPDLEMPPRGKLPDTVISAFETWIRIGAPAPDSVPDSEGAGAGRTGHERIRADADHWSFRPLSDPAVPDVEDEVWPRGAIDRFLLAKIESVGLAPVGDAPPRTLVRRLWLDLVGLPPPPEVVESFVRDPSDEAFEALVDRLLDSPHYGERMARRWLDVARYSDSTGGGRTRALDSAWRYRDWTIDAFQSDKPYDRFIREQIAGDLIAGDEELELETRREALTATAFLVLGPTNYENQDKDLLRMDVVDEQIDTMGRAFLAMTLGCARCHDHKFDPVPTTDYYALAGIFRSTKTLTPGNVSGFVTRELPLDREAEREVAAWRERLEEARGRVQEAKRRLAALDGPPTANRTLVATVREGRLTSLPGVALDDAGARKVGEWTASTSVRPFVGAGYIHDGNAGKGERAVIFEPEIPRAGRWEVRVGYTPGANRAPAAPVTIRHAEGETIVHIDQRRPGAIGGLFASVGVFRFETGQATVRISNERTEGHVIVDAVWLHPADTEEDGETSPRSDADAAARLAREQATAREELANAERAVEELQRGAPSIPRILSVQDEDETGDWHVHIRGEIRNLGPKVPRGFLSVLGDADPAIAASESGRRELADWIASPRNPLTPRVWANRVWQHLFGEGLVRTVDNFGATGELPSHPELLDWLASRLIEDDWSTKRLVRRIVLSRAWRLSSRSDATLDEADPENRLLARRSVRRLDAEAIRDSILTASGELDLTPGGPSISTDAGGKPMQKIEYGYRFTTLRRSIYVPIFRNTLFELFEVFDFADPNLSIGRRTTSTRSTQGLYLLNSAFLLERSTAFARRVQALEGDDADRVHAAWQLALGRPPRAAELSHARAFLGERPDLEAWTGLCQALFASVDFLHLR